ncbi:PEP-CTERM sorting domain-containing protein [Aeoliella sp. SH292]|uniref:PEP-CTERM sorting domain-containing protein n=1 Tax=Aeoliella sp. SH292 TaxID=3454464 RepID=UPI003F9718D4
MSAKAADISWSRSVASGVGNWSDTTNWGGGVVPTADDTARLTNGGMILVDSSVVADRILFGANTNSGGSMEVATGGSLLLDGGASQIAGGLGSDVTINVTGGTLSYTGTQATDLGRFGTAVLNVSAGEFSVGAALRVGVFERDGQATINLSGGKINVGTNFSVMQGASNSTLPTRDPFGKVFQTGGEVIVAQTTYVGFPSAGAGTALYEIGSAKLDTLAMSIGGSNEAKFRITDAAADVTVRASLSLGNNTYWEAVPGSVVKFTASTGSLILDTESPFFNMNVYHQNSLDIANATRLAELSNTTFVFAGSDLAGAQAGLFEIAGADMGAVEEGYTNNFALGGLTIGQGATIGNLKLSDLLLNGGPEATPQALYVDQLNLTAGSTLDLNGLNLYYRSGSILGTVLGGTLTQLPGSGGLAGDYNNDGMVNLADYTVWRDNLVSTVALPNDEIGGTIGTDQYNQWKANFGESTPMLSTSTVPEPSAVLLLAVGGLLLLVRRQA